MATHSLEDKLQQAGSAVKMLRDSPSGPFKSPYPLVHSNWQDEQEAWHKTAVLFDQSHHMTDVYFTGPDVKRLLADTGTNSFATYGRDKAKHFLACTESGQMIGTAVLFGLEEQKANLVGPAAAANWVQYQAEAGNYQVDIIRDERTNDKKSPQLTHGYEIPRLTYRYEIEGPYTRQILEKATGGPVPAVKFFHMTGFNFGRYRARALSHTMAGVPGSDSMGFEIWGPADEGQAVLDILLEAGEEFGLVRGGMLAYYTGSIESGYAAQPVPAIYSDDGLKSYREWLSADGYEAKLSVGGSFTSDIIDDYYVTPFDFGYGHLVKFDHDFIGRTALVDIAPQPHRQKVWLRWNEDDVARVYRSSLFGGETRAKYLDTPLGRYARVQCDAVLAGDSIVGISTLCGYTVNIGSWMSVAFVDPDHAYDDAQVSIVWGEESGGTSKRNVEQHVQTEIRATVVTKAPA